MTDPDEATAACPSCGNVITPIPIVFGYPTPETFELAEQGQVMLGGCMIDGSEPTHACPICGQHFPERPDDDDEETGAFLSYLMMDD